MILSCSLVASLVSGGFSLRLTGEGPAPFACAVRAFGSPVRAFRSPVRACGSPIRACSSPVRASGSPVRACGSPVRACGIPRLHRGTLLLLWTCARRPAGCLAGRGPGDGCAGCRRPAGCPRGPHAFVSRCSLRGSLSEGRRGRRCHNILPSGVILRQVWLPLSSMPTCSPAPRAWQQACVEPTHRCPTRRWPVASGPLAAFDPPRSLCRAETLA